MADETTITSRAGLIEHRIGATGFLQLNTSSGDIDVRGMEGGPSASRPRTRMTPTCSTSTWSRPATARCTSGRLAVA